MLDIKFIRDHADAVKKNCANRGVGVDVDALLDLDRRRRHIVARAEELRALRNQGSKTKPTEEDIARMRDVGDEIAGLERELAELESALQPLLLAVPNMTHPDAPIGGENDFRVVATEGKVPKFSFPAQDHETLLTALGLIDFERGAKVAGTKFYFARGALVRLNQALLNYGIDVVTAHGYTLLETPDVARDEILRGIGFSPRGPETQTYSIENTDLSLIGTAEVTVGGYHANELLDLSSGPKKYVALSHCFRTEAGAHGRVSKGLYRVHQFTKLEMFVYCAPEDSERLHEEILAIEREIVDGLGIPYRVIDVASGDLGGPAYRKYDIEAWMVMRGPEYGEGNDGYGEITSTSNCTDYQARRLGIRHKTSTGENQFVHTLNGTAVVLSRFPIALVENYQTADGTIRVPHVLQKYMGGLEEIGTS